MSARVSRETTHLSSGSNRRVEGRLRDRRPRSGQLTADLPLLGVRFDYVIARLN